MHANCLQKRAFEQVISHTDRAILQGHALTQVQQRGLNVALQQLDIDGLAHLLGERGLGVYSQFLRDMMLDLASLLRSGSGANANVTPQEMALASRIFEELCSAENPDDTVREDMEKTRQLGLITFSFGNAFTLGGAADVRSYLNLSLVFFLLLGLISLIVFTWKAYVIALTLLTSRKTCKIPTCLRLQDVEVPGHITVLGTRSARFVPGGVGSGEYLIDFLKQQSELPKVTFEINGSSFPVNLHLAMETHCVVQFENSLERADLRRLFTYSIGPTRFVSRVKIKSNLKSINPNFA